MRLRSDHNDKAIFSAQTTRHSMYVNRAPLPPQTTHHHHRQSQTDRQSKLAQQIPMFERRNEIKWDENSAFVKKKVLPVGGRVSPRTNRSLFVG